MNIAEINAEGSVTSGHGRSTAPISDPEAETVAETAAETILPELAESAVTTPPNPTVASVPPLVLVDAPTSADSAPVVAEASSEPDLATKLLPAAASANVAASREFPCPNCGHIARAGELICTNCQFVLNTGTSVSTHRIEETEVPQPSRSQQTGDAIATQEKPITLEIDGTVLNLSIHETLIVGRRVVGEEPPDVDLTPFRAEEQGVSRRHLRLSRRGSLIYITDLHSTNRTYLNGRKLIPDGDRLIRSGDEIRLGRLKIKVRF